MSDYIRRTIPDLFCRCLRCHSFGEKQKVRSYRSSSWPATDGIVETGEVLWGGRSLTSTNFEYATAKLGYAYSVDEQSYSGYHTEWFGTAEEAWDYVKAWKGNTMRVRYCPRRPEVSVWREQEQVEK